MFKQGDKVVLGVSGGADSICLLFVLLQLREILGITLHVVHVDHGIREEAKADAAYVESLCRQYDIPFMLEEIEIKEWVSHCGFSVEEAGRVARHLAYSKACRQYNCFKIALAHNSNDRAETMLFHLFRGTGLKGMASILPVRQEFVRPLLCLERKEIETYLQEIGVSYRHDSTNDTDDYTRNRIRHHILPYAKEYVSANCIANMNRAADIFAQEEDFLRQQIAIAREKCVPYEDNYKCEISVEQFLQLHPAIRRRLLLCLVREIACTSRDIAAVHIEAVMNLFMKEGNRQVHLPYEVRARRSYGKVILQENREKASLQEVAEESQFVFTILEDRQISGEYHIFPENRYTKWFDYDKIVEPLKVRTRQTGDYLTIKGKDNLQHKKLKDYMITEKIPKEERERIPVLAEGPHILWAVGYRISEYYKVTEDTKRILQVEYKPKEVDIW